MKRTWKIGAMLCACLAAALFAAACPATHQARKPPALSGFLGNYEQLAEGKKGEALLVYFDRDAGWKRYTKIQFDPVTIWYNEKKSNMPEGEAQVLADYLDASIRDALKDDYEFVDRPGPDVLRLRVALTEANGSRIVLDTVSTVVPQMRTLSGLKRIATGTAAFVGRAGIEGEILDSMTNRRVAAAVDRRVGQKRVKGAFDKWDDVNGALDYWSGRLRGRLAELRGETTAEG